MISFREYWSRLSTQMQYEKIRGKAPLAAELFLFTSSGAVHHKGTLEVEVHNDPYVIRPSWMSGKAFGLDQGDKLLGIRKDIFGRPVLIFSDDMYAERIFRNG